MATHTPIPWTVPGGSLPQITITRSRASSTDGMTITEATSMTTTALSVSSTVATPSTIGGATSTSPTSSSTTFTTTTSSSGTLSSMETGSTSAESSSPAASVPSSASTSATSNGADGTNPIPSSAQTTATSPPPTTNLQDHSLAPGQIAAVVVGVVAFTVFVSVVAYLIRFSIMRRRQSSAEKRQRLDGGTMSQYYQGAAAASRSSHAVRSLREDEFRIVIRTPPPAEERPHQLWPSPPGGTQRYTFFSGRSTTTATDSATDRGQWSLGTENGSSGRSHGTRNN